jgi:NAD(P)-dependent dehydrogenase (short-subunit alcohol dehydrogenase family)
MSTLNGKCAVVTGGSRGIGFAIARALLDRGAGVVIAGTKSATVAKAAAALDVNRSGHVAGEVADVRNPADVDRLLAAASARFGGLDILVNNAGVGVFTTVADMSPQQWHDVIDTNVTGMFLCCRAAVPLMRQRGAGWIINISSLSATNPFPNAAAYCASKAAVDAFSQSFMQEVRHDGIRVAHVAPGSVNTNFGGHESSGADWKLAPEDVAQAVVDLIGHPARSLPSRIEIRPARPPKKG